MALLEAMSYGLAIVATAVGGVPDVVEPTGRAALVVAPGDAAGAGGDALAASAATPSCASGSAAPRGSAHGGLERPDAVAVADRLGSSTRRCV